MNHYRKLRRRSSVRSARWRGIRGFKRLRRWFRR